MESRTAEALKLIDRGVRPSEAAKAVGISRQAVAGALKRRLAEKRPCRLCSECGGELAPDARADAKTCSGACRAARMRRLKAEAERQRADRLRVEIERLRARMCKPD